MGIVSGSVWTGGFIHYEEKMQIIKEEEKHFIWIEPHALTMIANFYTTKEMVCV